MAAQSDVSFNKLFQMYSVMAQVVRAVDLTSRMRRVRLGGEGLRPLAAACWPADAIKLYMPEPGQAAVLPKFVSLPGWRKHYSIRAYTIRHFRPESLELDVDILLHGNTSGSVWARTVRPGDAIGFIGPRHDYRPTANADWQLLAGDESALPAIAAILEHLPGGSRAHAFIEVHDSSDEVPIDTQADVQLTWLHRGDVPAQDSRLLEQTLTGFTWPAGQGYCWVAGYSKTVRQVRRHLLDERRVGKEALFAMGYWS